MQSNETRIHLTARETHSMKSLLLDCTVPAGYDPDITVKPIMRVYPFLIYPVP
jgi:hypothetical protein